MVIRSIRRWAAAVLYLVAVVAAVPAIIIAGLASLVENL